MLVGHSFIQNRFGFGASYFEFPTLVLTLPVSPPPDSTSLSLLQRAKRNDADAWQSIVRLYGPLVHNWCLAARLQDSDLSDVFQEVFAAAASKLSSFRHDREGDTFRGWLRVITSNKIRDHFRRRAAHPPGVGGSDAMKRMADVAASDSHESFSLEESSTQIREVDVLYRRALSYLRKTFEPQTWDYVSWGQGRPQHVLQQDYVFMYHGGAWDDGNNFALPYIVEIEPSSDE